MIRAPDTAGALIFGFDFGEMRVMYLSAQRLRAAIIGSGQADSARPGTTVEHVRVYLRGYHVPLTDRGSCECRARLKQMRCETLAQSVADCSFGDVRSMHCELDCPLQHAFV